MRRKLTSSKAIWLVTLLALVGLLGACATGTIREQMLTMPTIDGACYEGQESCAGCHSDKAEGLESNVHGRLADWELMGAQGGCEACHGPGSKHVEGYGDTEKILQPGDMAPEKAAAICVKCHSDGALMDYTHSAHALNDVGCTQCHSIHGDSHGASLKAEDPELCYQCHQEYQAKAHYPSHHPIKEGKMQCADCHNVHGATGESLQTEERLNDLCLECHTRYQGPFVFGHAPVEDDCTICHDPHGSVANNLLVQNEPFLCLQCHEGHFHMLREGATPNGDENDDPQAQQDLEDANPHGSEGFQMSYGTKCTTCHKVVHGSDNPSQPLSGHGLTR